MDWVIPLITACAGLGGAMIAGRYVLKAQTLMQQNENARNLRKLAYEAAMLEWRERVITAREDRLPESEPGKIVVVPLPEFFILNHLAWIERIEAVGGAENFCVSDYEAFLREREFTVAQMHTLHERMKNELIQPGKNTPQK